MKAEEDASERTLNSIVTRSRGAIELKPHKPIVVRKQTRTISFNRVNHLFLSSFSFSFFLRHLGAQDGQHSRRKLLILITVVKLFYQLNFRLKQFLFHFPTGISTVSLKVNAFTVSTQQLQLGVNSFQPTIPHSFYGLSIIKSFTLHIGLIMYNVIYINKISFTLNAKQISTLYPQGNQDHS